MAQRIPDGQLLEAALQVIAEQGYARATTRDIAEAAEVNEVTLFRRFGNKKKLLKAAIAREARYFNSAGLEYSGDCVADLKKITLFYQELMETRGQLVAMLLTEIQHQPELLEVMREPLAIVNQIMGIMTRYQEEGVLASEPPMQAFSALVAPLFMSGVLKNIEVEVFSSSFDPEAHVERFLRGRLQAQG